MRSRVVQVHTLLFATDTYSLRVEHKTPISSGSAAHSADLMVLVASHRTQTAFYVCV